jgi:hypothetical protein
LGTVYTLTGIKNFCSYSPYPSLSPPFHFSLLQLLSRHFPQSLPPVTRISDLKSFLTGVCLPFCIRASVTQSRSLTSHESNASICFGSSHVLRFRKIRGSNLDPTTGYSVIFRVSSEKFCNIIENIIVTASFPIQLYSLHRLL